MKTWVRPRRGADERGAAAVELAAVLFVLVPIIFGIVGFGIVFAQQLALDNAARQAARFSVVGERTCADIVSEARSAATTINMRNTSATPVTVGVSVGEARDTAAATCGTGAGATVPCAGSSSDDTVYIDVGYTSELVVPLAVVSPDFDLVGRGSFRCEFS